MLELFDKEHPLPGKDYDFSGLKVFSRFRRYPGFSEADCFDIFLQDARELLSSAECGAARMENDALDLVVAVSLLPWDSGFFQARMGRLHVWKSDACPVEDCAEAVDRVLQSAEGEHGIRHISLDVDIDNYDVMNLALSRGFEVMDIKRAYFTNITEPSASNERGLSCVRPYVPADYPAIQLLLEDVVFETRYTRDRHLDPERARAMYRAWFESMLQGAGKHANVVVYERGGKIVACGAIGELDFSRYGIRKKVRTNSVVACSREGVGAYSPVSTRLTLDALETHDLMEGVVSLNNTAAVRVVEGIRPNRSITWLCLRRFSGR